MGQPACPSGATAEMPGGVGGISSPCFGEVIALCVLDIGNLKVFFQ